MSKELIRRALDMARWAPSGANRQPWHFVVVTERNLRSQLASSAKVALLDLNAHLRDAPVVIVACSDPQVSKWHLYDVSAAVMCLLLALEALGLGACWVGIFDEDRVKKILGVTERLQVAALIPCGYPAEEPIIPPRLEVSEIAFWERWGGRDPGASPPPAIRVGRRGVPSALRKVLRNFWRTTLHRKR